MGHALGNNYGKFYSFKSKPVLADFSFIVDSLNGNGLGVRSVKGQVVKNVFMNVQSGLPGTPNLASSRSYAVLGASAVTNTGSSVLTGNLGLTPGSSITGFPPGTFSGAENIDNPAAVAAQSQALAAYNDLQSRTSTVIPSALDGQTLTPGVYSFASGAATLAASGNGTLTLNGAGVYVIKTTSTLGTGAGGIPTIALTGGATAANVYWAIGSSATLNISGSGVFQGNLIANTSITIDGGSANGSLIALNGAVTISAATAIAAQPLSGGFVAPGNPNPAPGYALIQLEYNYNYYNGGFAGFVSPLAGTNYAINGSALVPGNPYVIVSPGHSAPGQVSISPVADVSGSLASTWFRLYDSYGNTFIVWFNVSGVGSAPVGVSGTLVEVQISATDSAATVGTKMAVILGALSAQQLATPFNPNVLSYTASGSTTVTLVNTNVNPYRFPGFPADGTIPTGFAFAWPVNDSNLADWQAVGLPKGIVPQVGASFIATRSGFGSSNGLVQAPSVSGINSIEIIGDPNVELGPVPQGGSPNTGGWILVQFLSNGVPTAPKDNSVCGMNLYLEFGSKAGGNFEQ